MQSHFEGNSLATLPAWKRKTMQDRVMQWVLGSYVKERKHKKLMSQVVKQLIS